MKQLLEQVFSRISLLDSGLNDSSIEDSPDDALFNLTRFIKENGFDTALGLRLAALLQLSNVEAVYNQYYLKTIEEMYDSLLTIQPNNLDLYLEAAHFADSVLDQPTKALNIIERASILIDKMNNELTKLKDSIKDV